MEELSPEEVDRIMTLKAQRPFPWPEDAFDRAAADLMNKPPEPPRFHLIILTGPFDTAETVQRIAQLSETPAIESTKTIPKKDGETVRTVSFCRVDDTGLCNIINWASEHGYYASPHTHVVFGEGKERRAVEAHFVESMLNGEDEGFTDDEGE